jgi:uncharacterized membrane protein YhaH (DUF805 family)
MEELGRLLFSFAGRINRMQFLGAVLCELIGMIIIAATFDFLDSVGLHSPNIRISNEILAPAYLCAMLFISFWITLAIYLKRYASLNVPKLVTLVLFFAIAWLSRIMLSPALKTYEQGGDLLTAASVMAFVYIVLAMAFYVLAPLFLPPHKWRRGY